MLKKNLTVGLVRIIVVFTKIYISKVKSVSMETNPLKMFNVLEKFKVPTISGLPTVVI